MARIRPKNAARIGETDREDHVCWYGPQWKGVSDFKKHAKSRWLSRGEGGGAVGIGPYIQ